MKTYLSILGALLVLCATLLAQAPPPANATAVDPNATNAATLALQMLRQQMASNAPGARSLPIQMSAQPAGPPALRPMRPSNLPAAPDAAAPTPTPTPPAPATAPSVAPAAPNAATTAAAAGTNVAAAKAAEPIYQKDGLRLQELDLNEFLDKIYAETVGRTILRAPNLPAAKITLRIVTPLTKPEFIQLLDSVLALNGISMIPVDEKFVKAIPSAQALQEAAQFKTSSEVASLPGSGQYVTHIVQLKYIRPADVVPAIQPFSKTPSGIVQIEASNVLVLRDFTENVKRMLEIIEKVDVTYANSEIKTAVIPIKYALASEIAGVLGSLQGAGGGVTTGAGATGATGSRLGGGIGGGVGGASRGSVLRSSATGGLGGGLGGFGGVYGATGTGGLGQPGYNPAVGGFAGGVQPGGINTGAFGAAGANQSSFQQRLQQIVNRAAQGGGGQGSFQILGDVRIITDDRTNSLLVFANVQDMETIKQVIAKLDVVLAQVLIEAIIMEVSLDDGRNVGIAAGQRPKALTDNVVGGGVINNNNDILGIGSRFLTNAIIGSNLSSFPSGSGFGYFGKIGSTWDVAVNAVATDSAINVLSRPRIQTSHAIEASLFIGDTVPYITGTINDVAGARSQYQQLRVGITLNVLPLINPDGLVVMDISQNVQQLGTPTKIDGNDVPTTTERSASAKVAVRDRETIILGGFISTTKSKSRSGVPLLKDIPVIGNLFTSRSDSTRRVELVILMRPTVLPTPEAASAMRQYETDNLPGVRSAEREILSDQYSRQRKQGIDPDRPAPMFKDNRPREAIDLLPPPPARKDGPEPATP